MRVRRQLTDQEGASGAALSGTSSTALVPGPGGITVQTQANLGFAAGARVRLHVTDDPETYMDGTVTSYVGTDLAVLVDRYVGTVEHASWRIVQFYPGVVGDMRFGSQDADFYRDVPEAVAQAVLTRLRLATGEWFLDSSEGTPYAGAILGAGKRATIEPAYRARILGTPGVRAIEDFSLVIDADQRRVTIAATISTVYGQAQLQGVL